MSGCPVYAPAWAQLGATAARALLKLTAAAGLVFFAYTIPAWLTDAYYENQFDSLYNNWGIKYTWSGEQLKNGEPPL